ncbi:MAG: 4'-phosphopantetheinyl transferase family protein [Deltaproteobacteria bacterium]
MSIILKTCSGSGFKYVIGKRNESISFYLDKISHKNLGISQVYGSKPERILEWLSSRYLLTSIMDNAEHIIFDYDKYGKPFILGSDKFISISHSDEMLAAAVSDYKIGIDIERSSNRTVRVKEKFASQNDLAFLNDENEMMFLTRLWTVKEAVYKAYGKKGIDFKEQINLISENECVLNLENSLKLSYKLHSELIEDYFFTVAYQKNSENE